MFLGMVVAIKQDVAAPMQTRCAIKKYCYDQCHGNAWLMQIWLLKIAVLYHSIVFTIVILVAGCIGAWLMPSSNLFLTYPS